MIFIFVLMFIFLNTMTTTINTNLLLDISIFWTGGGRHKIETTQLDSMANGRYEHMDQLNHFVGSGTSVVLLYLLVVTTPRNIKHSTNKTRMSLSWCLFLC
jgi:hypothetical protein